MSIFFLFLVSILTARARKLHKAQRPRNLEFMLKQGGKNPQQNNMKTQRPWAIVLSNTFSNFDIKEHWDISDPADFRGSRVCCGCAAAPSSAVGAAQLLPVLPRREKRKREGREREKFAITRTELWSIANSNLQVFKNIYLKKNILPNVSSLAYLQNKMLDLVVVKLT